MTEQKITRRLNGSGWLVLLAAVLVLLLSMAQVAYRLTLPTDGWGVLTGEIEGANWIFYENLVGAESDLQVWDEALAVDGRSVSGSASNAYVPAPENWQIGQTVTMLMLRDGAEMEVSVPVVAWTGTAVWQHNTATPGEAMYRLGAVLLLIICWFTFLSRPDIPSARALLMFGVASGAVNISGIVPDGLSVQFDQSAFYLTLLFSYVIFGALLAPSLLTFTLLFPRPKQVIQRHPWLAFLPFVYGLLLLIFPLSGGRGEVGWVSTMGMLILAIVSLAHAGVTQRDAASRAQLRWAITSFVAGILLFGLNFPLAFNWVTDLFWINIFTILSSLSPVVIGAGLAVAVLRYRLFDIDLIIRKTVQYGVLSALLALVYFCSVVLLQTVVGRATDAQSPLAIVLSTLLIAALFNPLRRHVQTAVDRRFYRQKYNAQQVLAQFAQVARDETDIEALTAELVRVVQETMQPEQVSVWLKLAKGERPFP
ncbi:MAG: hypothetical protein IPM39_11065 [Chloroflexi bacterium]|nr:hypothetical protein [Chloroflexota bacterium]